MVRNGGLSRRALPERIRSARFTGSDIAARCPYPITVHGVVYLLPGFIAGVFTRSGGSLSGSKASTDREIRL